MAWQRSAWRIRRHRAANALAPPRINIKTLRVCVAWRGGGGTSVAASAASRRYNAHRVLAPASARQQHGAFRRLSSVIKRGAA